MKRQQIRSMLVCVCCAAALAGCATPSVQYGDAGSAKPVSTDFGSSDLQQIASSMVDSLITFPPIVEVTAQKRPVISVDKVKNKSMQHIDTESITDSIRTKLIKSGKFQFIDRTTDAATVEEIQVQQNSGLVDPRKAVNFGTQTGADYLLTANFSEISQKSGSVTDVYYKFTMNLKNLRTGILEWSDEKEIRKVFTRPFFGE
jgi:penicillin-binding protein activator